MRRSGPDFPWQRIAYYPRIVYTGGVSEQGLAQEIGCKAGEEGSGGANAASANVGGKQFTRQSAHCASCVAICAHSAHSQVSVVLELLQNTLML